MYVIHIYRERGVYALQYPKSSKINVQNNLQGMHYHLQKTNMFQATWVGWIQHGKKKSSNTSHMQQYEKHIPSIQSTEPRKKSLLLSIESWLFNRDPYNGLLQSPRNWVGSHPLNTLNNQVFVSLLNLFWHIHQLQSMLHLKHARWTSRVVDPEIGITFCGFQWRITPKNKVVSKYGYDKCYYNPLKNWFLRV